MCSDIYCFLAVLLLQWLKKTRRKAVLASLEKIKEGERSCGFNPLLHKSIV